MAPKKTVDASKKYVKLDQKEHVLTRPGMYIGSIETDTYDTWVYSDDQKKMIKKQLKYIPGLFKIFDEIIVNAIDHAIRLKSKKKEEVGHYVKNIRINIDKETGIIEVSNDGDGIEIIKHTEHNIYIPELIFGNLLTSTNYDDTEEKTIGGQNGLGAKCTNIFSEFFEIETVDAVRKSHYIQRFESNMTIINTPIITKYTKKPFTTIRFKPDYKRFNIKIGDDIYNDMFDVMKKRVYDTCAVTDKDVIVWLNNEKLDYKTFERYVDLYIGSKSEHVRVYEEINERWEIVASYNEFNGFEHISFVNGIWTIRGGKHVEYITNQITKKLIDLIQKRRKDVTIKPQSVKDNLILFVKSTIVNPTFDSQSKETLTTPSSKFGSKAEISDKFIDKLYKSGIVEKLVEISNIQGSNDMKKTDGKKKDTIRGIYKLDDANWAGTSKSSECTLILTEGDSAKTMVIAGLSKLGRDKYGVFPLRGKLLNVKDINIKRIMENEEITNLKKILGLESGKEYKNISDLRYGKIMVLTDQDVDGSHIKGLLFNMFHSLWPSLMKDHNFITSMLTPIVKAGKKGELISFYNLTEFENWKIENNSKDWNIKYYKGLGTSTEEEAMQYFEAMKTIDYKYTGNSSDDKLDLAFNKKKADDRKEWLSEYNKQNILNYADQEIKYEDFIDRELIHFSNYDLERSIPNICDGFKVSQRKIMYSCFKKNLVEKEIRVAQLAAYVSENAAYHHGEASLQGAIVSMAQVFVGSNNINILLPNGQFGSRISGGKDASQPRYIHTLINPIALDIYKKEDVHILHYLDDDGYPIEPEHYIPIIPMILVNGAIGIGTGFSTNIPCYNPKDIIQKLKMLLNNEEVTEDISPWYHGFQGKIQLSGNKYYSSGIYNRIAPTKIQVTELPIGYWTEDFKIMLEEMLDSSKEKEKSKESKILKNYESNYTHCKVDFTLTFTSSSVLDDLLVLDSNGYTKLENMFKLVSPKLLSTSNMYLFNENGQITKYDTAISIIKSYYTIRLRYYQIRKDYMISKMQKDIDIMKNKIRFIKAIISNEIEVSKYKKVELEELLGVMEYMKVEDSYDYLVRIPIYNITKDKVEDLENDIIDLESKLDIIQNTTINEMWLDDLKKLEVSYDKYSTERDLKNNGVSNKATKRTITKRVVKKT
jgi:DNA topoisomerase-2